MAAKRLSSKEFQVYIKAMIDKDGPWVKYQNPTAWRKNRSWAEHDIMIFNFSLRKKSKKGKLIGEYVKKRIHKKRLYQEQLDLLDSQLQDGNIDNNERDRLRIILEAKYYEKQQDDWKKFQKIIK